MSIYQKGVLEFGGPAHSDSVPLVVIQILRAIVLDANSSITQIKHVMHVAIDQLDSDEILALASVEHEQAIGLERFESEGNADVVIGLHLWEPQESHLVSKS